jgi:hypothetical protein
MPPKGPDPRNTAAARRDLAKRARRIAEQMSPDNRRRLLAYAEELEEQAARLEADATEPAPLPIAPIPPQRQAQVQQQQQGPARGPTPKV